MCFCLIGNKETGLKYYYMDNNNRKWVKGDRYITDQDNALYYTLQSVYEKRTANYSAYFLYNDEPPNSDKVTDEYGATKGRELLFIATFPRGSFKKFKDSRKWKVVSKGKGGWGVKARCHYFFPRCKLV